MKVLVTGTAGFIGSHISHRLLERGDTVIGIDNLNDYYDVGLKEARLSRLTSQDRYHHEYTNIVDRMEVNRIFAEFRPDRIVHMAAQAGVRYSLEQPSAYIDSNIIGFLNLLESVREFGSEHFVYASSSSVYGNNTNTPFSVHHNVDHPVSLYAATKKSNELMAHTYSHLFNIPCTGLRFFTVYGPWGRPDMALFKFTRHILAGEPIEIYNYGHQSRDFTYIDDIVEGVIRVLDRPATANPDWSGEAPDPHSSSAPYRLYNIGSHRPTALLKFVEVLEETLGIKADKRLLPPQPGDMTDTYADVDDLIRDVGYQPETPIEAGIQSFVAWYKEYHNLHDVAHNV